MAGERMTKTKPEVLTIKDTEIKEIIITDQWSVLVYPLHTQNRSVLIWAKLWPNTKS